MINCGWDYPWFVPMYCTQSSTSFERETCHFEASFFAGGSPTRAAAGWNGRLWQLWIPGSLRRWTRPWKQRQATAQTLDVSTMVILPELCIPKISQNMVQCSTTTLCVVSNDVTFFCRCFPILASLWHHGVGSHGFRKRSHGLWLWSSALRLWSSALRGLWSDGLLGCKFCLFSDFAGSNSGYYEVYEPHVTQARSGDRFHDWSNILKISVYNTVLYIYILYIYMYNCMILMFTNKLFWIYATLMFWLSNTPVKCYTLPEVEGSSFWWSGFLSSFGEANIPTLHTLDPDDSFSGRQGLWAQLPLPGPPTIATWRPAVVLRCAKNI